jgi:hypothetical protein
MPIEHFKSKEAERKNLAYRHLHGIPYTATTAVVAGKSHKVQHSTGSARKRIDAKQRAKVRGVKLSSLKGR